MDIGFDSSPREQDAIGLASSSVALSVPGWTLRTGKGLQYTLVQTDDTQGSPPQTTS